MLFLLLFLLLFSYLLFLRLKTKNWVKLYQNLIILYKRFLMKPQPLKQDVQIYSEKHLQKHLFIWFIQHKYLLVRNTNEACKRCLLVFKDKYHLCKPRNKEYDCWTMDCIITLQKGCCPRCHISLIEQETWEGYFHTCIPPVNYEALNTCIETLKKILIFEFYTVKS